MRQFQTRRSPASVPVRNEHLAVWNLKSTNQFVQCPQLLTTSMFLYRLRRRDIFVDILLLQRRGNWKSPLVKLEKDAYLWRLEEFTHSRTRALTQQARCVSACERILAIAASPHCEGATFAMRSLLPAVNALKWVAIAQFLQINCLYLGRPHWHKKTSLYAGKLFRIIIASFQQYPGFLVKHLRLFL